MKNIIMIKTIKEDTPLFIKDVIAKKIIANPEIGLGYAAVLIANVLDLPKDEVTNNLNYLHPNIGANANTVDAEVDSIFTDDKIIVDLEVNSSNGPKLQRKNQHYQFELAASQIKTHEEYLKLKPVIQINLDYFDYFKANKDIYVSKFMETTLHIPDNDDLVRYRINLLNLQKKDYNKVKENKSSLDYFLYFFVCGDERKLKKLYVGDKLMEEVIKLGKQIASERNERLYMTEEELDKIYRDDYAIMQYEKGIEKGTIQSKLEIAKNLLKKNMPDESIIEIVDISNEELKEIKKKL